MRFRRIGLISTLILGLLVAAPTAEAQEAIFLVRHTEEAESVYPDPPLTEAGQRRAKALAGVLKEAGIDVIFVSERRRADQTGELVAKALHVKVKEVLRRDIDELMIQLRTEHARDRVLIVSHSLIIPRLLRALGHSEGVVIDEYDNLFVVVPQAKGEPLVLRLRYGGE